MEYLCTAINTIDHKISPIRHRLKYILSFSRLKFTAMKDELRMIPSILLLIAKKHEIPT